ncbi:hypothetical protein EPUL_005007, partial [Erysiphe pulchra]
MHISTTVLYVALLSILGGSKTAHAKPYQDAFGVTNYGFKCSNRVYPKFAIYAAAKHFCDIYKKHPDMDLLTPQETGYRNRYYHGVTGDTINQFENSIIPILEDGTLYPHGPKSESRLVKNPAGEMVRIDPGPDRLLIDSKCNILGVFTDLDFGTDKQVPGVKHCRLLESFEDYFNPSDSGSPEQSPPRSPQRSREPSPERSYQRSREPSPERSYQRSREPSPERSYQRSRELSPGRSREQPLEQPLENNNPTDAIIP